MCLKNESSFFKVLPARVECTWLSCRPDCVLNQWSLGPARVSSRVKSTTPIKARSQADSCTSSSEDIMTGLRLQAAFYLDDAFKGAKERQLPDVVGQLYPHLRRHTAMLQFRFSVCVCVGSQRCELFSCMTLPSTTKEAEAGPRTIEPNLPLYFACVEGSALTITGSPASNCIPESACRSCVPRECSQRGIPQPADDSVMINGFHSFSVRVWWISNSIYAIHGPVL